MGLKIIRHFFVVIFCAFSVQISLAQQVTVINQKGTKIDVINNIVTSSPTEPTIKNIGDIWFDTTTTPSSYKLWDGTAWLKLSIGGDVTGTLENVTVKKIQNIAVSSTAPTNGQVLTFDTTASEWQPKIATNWNISGNTGTNPLTDFLGTIDDVKMQLKSNNMTMLEFGRRQTLNLTQTYPDYTDNDQPLVHINGNGTTSALQFAASGATFYKPLFFTTSNGSFRLKGSSGQSDFFEIGSAGPANDGRLEFIVGDDGPEPMVFKRYYYGDTTHNELFRVQGSVNGAGAKTRFGININPVGVPIDPIYDNASNSGNIANSTFQVNGSVSKSIFTTSTDLTLTEDHHTIILGGNHTITLPGASTCTGRIYVIKNKNAVATTVSSYTNNLGTAVTTINSNSSLTLQSDGVDWQQISSKEKELTGTTGSVFFAGATGLPSEDNTRLFWNITEENLYVGNSTLAGGSKLNVGGTTRTSGLSNSDGTVGLPSYRFTSDSDTGIFNYAANQLAFTTGGVEALRIDATQQVNVLKNLSVTGAYKDSSGDAGTNGQILSSTATGTDWISNPSTNNWSLTGNTGTDPALNFLGTTDNKDLVFKTFNTESGRISVYQLSTALGYNATAAYQGTAIGRDAVVGGNLGVAIGYQAKASNQNSTVAGALAQGNANNSTVYGYSAIVNSTAQNSTAIGANASVNANNQNSNAFGYNAKVNASGYVINATAIGTNASVSADNSTAVGYNALANQSNTVILGNNAKVGIGTSDPTELLDVNGKLRVRDISLTTTDNEILTVTSTGVVEKKSPSATVINKTANYTLTAADNGKVFTFNSSTALTLTVPTGLPIGFNISIYQTGTGNVTISGGATILNRLSRFKTAGKDAGVGLISTATNIFHLTGDLKL